MEPTALSQPVITTAAAAAAVVSNTNTTATSVDQRNQRQDPSSTPQQPVSQLANQQGNFPTAPRPGSTYSPLIRPSVLSFPERLASPQLTGLPVQPSPLNSDGQSAAPESSEVRGQNQTLGRSPESIHPAPVSAPQSPPGPVAIWKKNQGGCPSFIFIQTKCCLATTGPKVWLIFFFPSLTCLIIKLWR